MNNVTLKQLVNIIEFGDGSVEVFKNEFGTEFEIKGNDIEKYDNNEVLSIEACLCNHSEGAIQVIIIKD